MAYVKEVTTGSTKAAGNTAITVPAAGVAAGNRLVLHWSSADGLGQCPSSISDTAGNTWSKVTEIDSTSGSASAGAGAIWTCHVTTALVSGNTITASHTSTTNARCWALEEWSGVTAVSGVDTQNAARNAGTSTTPSVAATQSSGGTRVVVGNVSAESTAPTVTDDTDTDGGASWSTAPSVLGTTGGAAGTNCWLYGAHKIAAAGSTTHTLDPTLGATRTWVALIVILKESTGATVTAQPVVVPNQAVVQSASW